MKVDAPDVKVSLDLSYSQSGDSRRQSVRIKRVQAKQQHSPIEQPRGGTGRDILAVNQLRGVRSGAEVKRLG